MKKHRILKSARLPLKAIFVTGTDTQIGKTVVTGLIARYILEKGYTVITQKWIQSGYRRNDLGDISEHLKISGQNRDDIKDYLCHSMPYSLKTACSPHLALKIENKRLDVKKIKKSFRILSGKFDFVIVEGTGGALVPFDREHFIIDIVKDIGLPVIVVAQNKLGAINHSLLTIEALESRGLEILGIIFNNIQAEKKEIADDNPRIINILSKRQVFGVLPWRKARSRLYPYFIPIGNRIWRKVGLERI